MQLRRRREGLPPSDTGWRITPLGAALLILIPVCFVLGAVTGSFIFFAIGTFLLCVACAGYFASLPSPWRARGDEQGRTVDPLGDIIEPPGDE